jgi:hypothetical protein
MAVSFMTAIAYLPLFGLCSQLSACHVVQREPVMVVVSAIPDLPAAPHSSFTRVCRSSRRGQHLRHGTASPRATSKSHSHSAPAYSAPQCRSRSPRCRRWTRCALGCHPRRHRPSHHQMLLSEAPPYPRHSLTLLVCGSFSDDIGIYSGLDVRAAFLRVSLVPIVFFLRYVSKHSSKSNCASFA